MYHPIELEKIRNFKYGMKAISLAEKKFKKPIAKIDLESLTMEEMAVLIWAGLQHEDKNLTPSKVMDLIDEHSNVTKVFIVAGEALEHAFTGGEKIEEEAKN